MEWALVTVAALLFAAWMFKRHEKKRKDNDTPGFPSSDKMGGQHSLEEMEDYYRERDGKK